MSEEDTLPGLRKPGGEPTYAVTAVGEAEPFTQEFGGAGAFGRASDYYEGLKLLPWVRALQFHRREGGKLAWAAPPIKRGAGGEWVQDDP